MYRSGITPSELDKQDYLELLKIQDAKSREDRPKNTADAHMELTKIFGGG